ncbi:UNVERIFIED_CONTAM: hypothetical protein K2H54_044843 [Gekko kuhli]
MRTAEGWLPQLPLAQPLKTVPHAASGGARRGLSSPREWARPRHAPPPKSSRTVAGKVSAARRALKGTKRRRPSDCEKSESFALSVFPGAKLEEGWV